MDLELRHLRVVATVAECGSVTKAAAALGLAQPALTAQLNRIDRSLGGPVFVRDRTGSRPTALGELVLRHARVLLPAMDALVDDARRLVNARARAGSALRVGTANTAVGGLFVNRLHAALPGTTLTTSMSWSVGDLAADLAAGALDVALVGVCADAAPPPTGGVVWTRVATDPVFVLLAEEHPHATHDAVPLAELADAHWLTGPGDDCFDRCFVAACARAGFTPRGIGTTERASAVEQVRGGHAVGLVQPLLLDLPGVWAVPIAG
ncbi:LysR family transcriptional regulator, partial [Isoptericola variabilis]